MNNLNILSKYYIPLDLVDSNSSYRDDILINKKVLEQFLLMKIWERQVKSASLPSPVARKEGALGWHIQPWIKRDKEQKKIPDENAVHPFSPWKKLIPWP